MIMAAACNEGLLQCVGGYGLLLIGLGVLTIVPATLLIGLYADESGENMQPIAITLFLTSAISILLGTALTIFWCRQAGYKCGPNSDEEKAESCKDVTENTSCSSTGLQFKKTKTASSQGHTNQAGPGPKPDSEESPMQIDSPATAHTASTEA